MCATLFIRMNTFHLGSLLDLSWLYRRIAMSSKLTRHRYCKTPAFIFLMLTSRNICYFLHLYQVCRRLIFSYAKNLSIVALSQSIISLILENIFFKIANNIDILKQFNSTSFVVIEFCWQKIFCLATQYIAPQFSIRAYLQLSDERAMNLTHMNSHPFISLIFRQLMPI